MTSAAVITGDIIGSSKLKALQKQRLFKSLKQSLEKAGKLNAGLKTDQFRGDSFQAILTTQIEDALKITLLIHLGLKSKEFSARTAIGMGKMDFESVNIRTSDGSAFQNSGTTLDELKKRDQMIAIITDHEELNKEWKIHSLVLDRLLRGWSRAQAEAIETQINGLTQEQAAVQLHIKQPAVQQRLQAAEWPLLVALLERFKQSFTLKNE